MNPQTARVLRRYAHQSIPAIASRRFSWMGDKLYQLLKERWNAASHTERAVMRQHAKLNMPLPDDLKAEARRRDLIVEWPPRTGG